MKYQKYTEEQRSQALSLFSENNNASQTAQKLSIPRHVVRAWVTGGVTRAEDSKIELINPLEFNLSQKKAYSYILGLYLGDGCVSKTHKENVFRMRIVLDTKYGDMNDYAVKNMKILFPDNKVSTYKRLNENCIELSVYSTQLIGLFPQSGLGKKHNRKIELAQWQIDNIVPVNFVQGLFHSDGSYYFCQSKYPAYSFTNLSLDIKELYSSYLSRLNVSCSGGLNAKSIYSYGKQALALKELIGTKTGVMNLINV